MEALPSGRRGSGLEKVTSIVTDAQLNRPCSVEFRKPDRKFMLTKELR